MALVRDPGNAPDERVATWSEAYLAAVRADGHSEWRRELGDHPDIESELQRREEATVALVASVVAILDPSELAAMMTAMFGPPEEMPDDIREDFEREAVGKDGLNDIRAFLDHQTYPPRLSEARYVVSFEGGPFDGARLLVDAHDEVDFVSMFAKEGFDALEVGLRDESRPEPGEFEVWESDLLKGFQFLHDEAGLESEVARTGSGLSLRVHRP